MHARQQPQKHRRTHHAPFFSLSISLRRRDNQIIENFSHGRLYNGTKIFRAFGSNTHTHTHTNAFLFGSYINWSFILHPFSAKPRETYSIYTYRPEGGGGVGVNWVCCNTGVGQNVRSSFFPSSFSLFYLLQSPVTQTEPTFHCSQTVCSINCVYRSFIVMGVGKSLYLIKWLYHRYRSGSVFAACYQGPRKVVRGEGMIGGCRQ